MRVILRILMVMRVLIQHSTSQTILDGLGFSIFTHLSEVLMNGLHNLIRGEPRQYLV
jgi:hypothetical protein